MKSTPHILFHRPTAWASDVECSTKVLAKLFAEQRFLVTYLQSPLDPLNLLRTGGHVRSWRQVPFIDAGVRVVQSTTIVPVRDVWPLNSRTAAALRYQCTVPRLCELVCESGRPPPAVVWTTVPGSARALRAHFPMARIVFHVVDFYPAFRGRAVRKLELQDYEVADAVYVIGKSLAEYLLNDLGVDESKVLILGQGADLLRFEAYQPEPAEIAGLKHPRAVWCGVLKKGDPSLFRAAAEAMRAVGGTLVLVGPSADWSDALARELPDTVTLLGPKPPSTLPAILMHCDLGLMLYDRKRSEVYKGQNPLKLYEYAAAGLPIVSTGHDEFQSLSPPICEVVNEADVLAQIPSVLANAARLKVESLSFARRHDWRTKVSELIAELFPSGEPSEREL